MRRSMPAVVACLLLLCAACGDDGGESSTPSTTPGTTEAPTTSTTAEAPPTTAGSTSGSTVPTTTTATVDPVPTEPPAAYTSDFVDAWQFGDHARARQLGTQAAVDAIFAFDSGGGTAAWSLVQCEGAAGSSYCTFNAGGDPTIVVRVGNEAAAQGQPGAIIQVQVES